MPSEAFSPTSGARNVWRDPGSDLLPAGCLPGFVWLLVPAEAPPQRHVDVARIVGDRFQMHGKVMKCVAEDGPQELRLRMGRIMQRLHALGRVLFLEDAPDQIVGFFAVCFV